MFHFLCFVCLFCLPFFIEMRAHAGQDGGAVYVARDKPSTAADQKGNVASIGRHIDSRQTKLNFWLLDQTVPAHY